MSEECIVREDIDNIAFLTLNRPEKLNSITTLLFRQLDKHIGELERRGDDVGCVVVRGAGKCFSAGHDLAEISANGSEHFSFESATIERLANLPQAVITAVHGHCYTGALELALAGDVILASANAHFADTHARWALAPVWGMSQRLPRRVGLAKAREMMFTARTYSGQEAAAMGLANYCFPEDRFEDEVRAFAKSIVANSAFTVATYKRLMADTDGLPLHVALAHEIHRYPGFGPDADERIEAFMKRGK